MQEYDARRTGDLVSRVGTDTTLLYAVLTQGLADSIGNALIFVGAVVAMLVIDPVLLLLILVVVVTYLFLQNWRATLIPTLVIPIALLGTFLGMAPETARMTGVRPVASL